MTDGLTGCRCACRRHATASRRGFALLGVLWIVVGLSVVALALARVSRHALTRATSEHDRIVGRWLAEGCFARLRSIADHVLASDPLQAATKWRTLDQVVGDSIADLTGCELMLQTDGRIVLDRASVADLDTLPGMTLEAAGRVIQLQQARVPISDLSLIEGGLTPAARALFDAHYVTLVQHTTGEPDAWMVRVRARVGDPPTPVNIVVRLVRAGTRAAIMRWVEW